MYANHIKHLTVKKRRKLGWDLEVELKSRLTNLQVEKEPEERVCLGICGEWKSAGAIEWRR